jgi:hypothetical protein
VRKGTKKQLVDRLSAHLADPSPHSELHLGMLRVNSLRALCVQNGVSPRGLKWMLARRLAVFFKGVESTFFEQGGFMWRMRRLNRGGFADIFDRFILPHIDWAPHNRAVRDPVRLAHARSAGFKVIFTAPAPGTGGSCALTEDLHAWEHAYHAHLEETEYEKPTIMMNNLETGCNMISKNPFTLNKWFTWRCFAALPDTRNCFQARNSCPYEEGICESCCERDEAEGLPIRVFHNRYATFKLCLEIEGLSPPPRCYCAFCQYQIV